MSAVDYASVRQAIQRGNLAPVYYLAGEEEILKDELVSAIVDAAVDPASRDFNVDIRGAGDLNGESLHTLLETPPMLAERRVVVVRGIEQWRKNSKIWSVLFDYLGHPSPTTILTLTGAHEPDASIAKNATTVSVEAPDADGLRSWAIARATGWGMTLEPEAATHLIRAVAGSLSMTASEVDKLGASLDTGAAIGVAEIEKFVGVRHGETLTDWIDAVVQRDLPRAIKLLDVVLPQPGMTAVKMLNAMGTTLLGSRLARALADQRKNERQVKDGLWRYLKSARPRGLGRYGEEVERWLAAAKRWRTKELDAALTLMHEADEQLKSTTLTDPRATMTTLLLRFRSAKEAV
ncbi:MAG: DNA polymerase III subunit delta [Planctomycetota bacterium]|nr:DNA polymerase III subunit delta [Planctomycetota bacterium]